MDTDIATRYGYIVSDAQGTLELQRLDEVEKFPDDDAAVEQFRADLAKRDRYAIKCLIELMQNYASRQGNGRDNLLHDMDQFALWDSVWMLLNNIDNLDRAT